MSSSIPHDSEFGKGLTYCLGLFLCHTERGPYLRDTEKTATEELLYSNGNYSIWFNAAADHLYELMIPATLPEELKERLNTFRHKCLDWRMVYASKEDMEWAIKEAKTLLLEIDKHFGVEVERGTWE